LTPGIHITSLTVPSDGGGTIGVYCSSCRELVIKWDPWLPSPVSVPLKELLVARLPCSKHFQFGKYSEPPTLIEVKP
jgi:hypothetical protein